MPYVRNSELPQAVRNALPDAAQSIFRNAFNSQQKRGLSEERCFQSAWGAVQNAGYHKAEGGSWVKKQQPGMDDVHVDAPGGKKRRKKPDEPGHDEDEEMEKACGLVVKITKVDADQRLVFGWLSVIEENGRSVVDLQDHLIEADELENAAYDFMLNSRIVGEMHERLNVGEGMVESMMFTKAKQEALGIDLGKIGWWVGFKVDPDVFEKVKSGELSMFSIGGSGFLEDMLEAA